MNIRSVTIDRSKLPRSRVTNGKRMLEGCDRRSREGRRFRDLQIAYADDLGGPDKLSEVERTLIIQAATSKFRPSASRRPCCVVRRSTRSN